MSFTEELRKTIEDFSKKHNKKVFIIGVLDNDEEDFVTCIYGTASMGTLAKCHLSMGAALADTIKDKAESECGCPECIKERGDVN
jgi:hypothetical protein